MYVPQIRLQNYEDRNLFSMGIIPNTLPIFI